MESFWHTQGKPFLALAPMEDVTDTVFREVILSVSGKNMLNVVFTEFTSTDGLCHEQGRLHVSDRLRVNDSERVLLNFHGTKLVAQIWGSDPEKFYKSAQLITALGQFDGIDINMGCPVKKVVNHKSCSALINYPELAREIVQATKEGTHLPVSVKTRLGFKTPITEEWIGHLLEAKPQAITIHGRTQKMMSKGDVMWDEIAKAVKLRNSSNCSTVIIGNGDITGYADAMAKAGQYGIDGAMIGTGVFKDPWLFNQFNQEVTLEQKIGLLRKHVELFERTWGKNKNYNILKRFYKIYLHGFRGASEYRERLMGTNSYQDAYSHLDSLLKESYMLEQ